MHKKGFTLVELAIVLVIVTNANRDVMPSCCFGKTYLGNLDAINTYDGLAVDKKIDDGSIVTGNAALWYYAGAVSRQCVFSDGKCVFYIKMLMQVGQ